MVFYFTLAGAMEKPWCAFVCFFMTVSYRVDDGDVRKDLLQFILKTRPGYDLSTEYLAFR